MFNQESIDQLNAAGQGLGRVVNDFLLGRKWAAVSDSLIETELAKQVVDEVKTDRPHAIAILLAATGAELGVPSSVADTPSVFSQESLDQLSAAGSGLGRLINDFLLGRKWNAVADALIETELAKLVVDEVKANRVGAIELMFAAATKELGVPSA